VWHDELYPKLVGNRIDTLLEHVLRHERMRRRAGRGVIGSAL
jgi:hypothetical protein